MTIRISASQIRTFRDCPKAWAFEKLARLERATSPKMQFGKDVHARLEAWLDHATPFPRTPEGRVAEQAVRPEWIPPPKLPKVRTEIEIGGRLPWFPEGVELAGFIDVLDLREYAATGRAIVIDYKSTSDMRWSMTEDEMRSDPQALLYAAWAIFEGAAEVLCRWVYLAASNPKSGSREPKGARATEVLFRPGPEFTAALEPVLDAIRGIVALRTEAGHSTDTIESVDEDGTPRTILTPRAVDAIADGNTANCQKYGGCSHRASCPMGQDPVTAIVALVAQDIRIQSRKRTLTITPD